MPFPLIIPIVLAGLAALGLSACPTTRRPEDDNDVTPTPDDDDTAPVDDDDATVSPLDADSDTYYNCDTSDQAQYEDILCGDCDDSDPAINPAATDNTNDNVDNNCNGSIDEDYVEPDVCDGFTRLQFNPDPFVIEGEDEYDGNGMAVSGGDIDGDGINDLVLGFGAAWDETLETMGKVYSMLGGDNIVPGGFMLVTEADATWTGSTEEAGLGGFVATVDLDGNGQADILMTSEDNINVVYNPLDANPTTAVLQGDGIFGPHLFVIPDIDEVGGPGELVVGGQGQFDIIPLENIGSGTQSIEDIRRYHVEGEGYTIPYTVAAGDMDGDGWAEVAVGDNYDDNPSEYRATGKTYLLEGGSLTDTVTLDPNGSTGANVFTLTGTVAGQDVGATLASGDTDGDGLTDLFIGAQGTDNGDLRAGVVHKISSQANFSSLYGTTMALGIGGTLTLLPESAAVYGNAEDVELPSSIAVVTDAECGLLAVVVGVDNIDSTFVLSAATLEGLVGTENATVDEADQALSVEEADRFGWGVYSIGDVNGDGIPDLAVTAEDASEVGNENKGAVYIFLGDRI